MKMTLTEKDKKLLVMLSVFVIVVCIGYWGIYPVLKETKKLSKEIESAKDIQTMNEDKQKWLPILEKDNLDLEAQIVDKRSTYFPLMTNSEIDRYFTALVLDYSLYAYDLLIDSNYKEASLQPYVYSSLHATSEDELMLLEDEENTKVNDEKSEKENEALEFEYSETSEIGVYSIGVTLRLGGDEAALRKLIDDLSEDTKLRIVRFQWSNDSNLVLDPENDDYEMVASRVLTLSLEMYMYEE